MKDLVLFLVICATGIAGFVLFLATLPQPFWIDRLVVILLRRLGLGMALFPTAVGIAVSIITHPEQWSSDGNRLIHPDIGRIWIANKAWGIHVDTEMGRWEPNWIERRIIREAVDWRLSNYIRDRLEVTVRKNALR
jgi:hypothetical protein